MEPEPGLRLDVIAADRARALAPFVCYAQLASFVLSNTLGVTLSTTAIVWNLLTIPAMLGAAVLLWARRLPASWGHAALAYEWWIAVGGTLVSLAGNGSPVLTIMFLVEIAAAGSMLSARWAIGCLLLANAAWIPLCIRDHGGEAPGYVLAVLLAQVFAIVQQRLVLRSLLQAESARRAEAELHDQLVHAQRMEVAGTLAAGLAHDMNNVLASITTLSELLARQVTAPAARADVDHIRVQAERGAELTRGLLAFSRHGKYRKLVVTFDDVIREVMPLLQRTLAKTIEIRTELDAAVAVEGDPAQLGQVLLNLGVNAADAIGTHGVLTISTRCIDGRIQLRVTDTGAGMSEETRRRVFEPFFTTKARGRGTGLGLAIVWGIVESHHGTIEVDSALGVGTTFTIELPRTDAPLTVAPSPPPTELPRRPRTATILVIDDEPSIRAGTTRMLESAGMRVLTADNGESGLAVYDAHASEIDLVILDMGMPVMSGGECFERLRERADVPVVITTGYAIEEQVQAMVARGAVLIEKPYRSRDLLAQLATQLGPLAPRVVAATA